MLFWGAMTDRPLIGLILALIVESPNWLPFRWSFSNNASSVAWRISIILTTLTGALIWFDGDRYTAVPRAIGWLPVLLLPIQLIQLFGFANYLDLRSFSFFSRFYRDTSESAKAHFGNIHFNFGNVYFITAIIAASLGKNAQHFIFYPCVVILTGWLIFARRKNRAFALVAILMLGSAVGITGQIGLSKLYHWLTNRDLIGSHIYDKSPTMSKTSIGSLGEIKQSPEIFWRINTQADESPPRLLRLASYNRYRGINWKNTIPDVEDEESSFRELTTIEIKNGEPNYLLRETMQRTDLEKNLPTFRIRGRSGSEKPLPLPGSASSLKDFELDGIDINPLGTVRVFPKRAIIEGSVRWNDQTTPESAPFAEEDLHIDTQEEDGIREIAAQLGLNDLPTTAAKLARLRAFFDTEFEYSRYLTIRDARATRSRPSAIETFLTTEKRGHCEYFATSATLLLRAAGVPARYCVGFAVMERKDMSDDEYIIRGTHGHAWTRVWDTYSGTWIDFDPTPSGWIIAESGGSTNRMQWFTDAFQCLKEDFFLWRNEPGNRLGATIVMWALGISVCLFVGRRLWKSKVIVGSASNRYPIYGNGTTIRTPLHDLEPAAQKILEPRKVGETLPSWLEKLKAHGLPIAVIDEARDIHQSLRFDPSPADKSKLDHLKELTAALRKRILSR